MILFVDALTGETSTSDDTPVDYRTHADIRSQQYADIQSSMAALDLKSIRALRTFRAGTATDEDTAFLIDIETQQAALREKLAALNGDTDG